MNGPNLTNEGTPSVVGHGGGVANGDDVVQTSLVVHRSLRSDYGMLQSCNRTRFEEKNLGATCVKFPQNLKLFKKIKIKNSI